MQFKNKLKTVALALSFAAVCSPAIAQNKTSGEQYGHALNLGLGFGYGGVGSGLMLAANYEFDVAKNFTIAPFIAFQSYSNAAYSYTIIPIGAKGSYYFDDLLKAPSDWDFYLGLSLGYSIESFSYKFATYTPVDKNPLFLGGHLGAEYHVSPKVGIALDLGSRYSTIGVGLHL